MASYAHIAIKWDTKKEFENLLQYGETADTGLARIIRAFKEHTA